MQAHVGGLCGADKVFHGRLNFLAKHARTRADADAPFTPPQYVGTQSASRTFVFAASESEKVCRTVSSCAPATAAHTTSSRHRHPWRSGRDTHRGGDADTPNLMHTHSQRTFLSEPKSHVDVSVDCRSASAAASMAGHRVFLSALSMDVGEAKEKERSAVDDAAFVPNPVKVAKPFLGSNLKQDRSFRMSNRSFWPQSYNRLPKAGYPSLCLDTSTAVLSQVAAAGHVRVFSMTWNMHGKVCRVAADAVRQRAFLNAVAVPARAAQSGPKDLAALLPVGQYHVYAIGTQECMRSIAKSVLRPSKDAWEVRRCLPVVQSCVGAAITTLCCAGAASTLQALWTFIRHGRVVSFGCLGRASWPRCARGCALTRITPRSAGVCVCLQTRPGCHPPVRVRACGSAAHRQRYGALLQSRRCAAAPPRVSRLRCFEPVADVQSDAIATGIGNKLGNKGGVGVSFSLGQTSMLFVCAHFSAHQNAVEERNRDFHRIDTGLNLCPSGATSRRAAMRATWC